MATSCFKWFFLKQKEGEFGVNKTVARVVCRKYDKRQENEIHHLSEFSLRGLARKLAFDKIHIF
jgi:hypothetical protein